jgi:hypothetical protein
MYTTLQKIEIAKVSQYLCANDIDKKALFGGGIDLQLPNKIYNIRKSVEWLYDITPVTSETQATASITIDAIGLVGDSISVYVKDPILGLILLGSYIQSISDTDVNLLATNIAGALSSNTYSYIAEAIDNIITITARPGIGATINGNNLVVELYSNILITEDGNILITEDGNQLISE